MDRLDSLQEHLSKMPGIGARQARRLAFFLLQSPNAYVDDLVDAMTQARSIRHHCSQCNRLFFLSNSHQSRDECQTCADSSRDGTKLMLVARQADFEQIERSGSWRGYYFILGRLARLADKQPLEKLPMGLLNQRLADFDLQEVVFALPVNPEGEYTAQILEDHMVQNTALASMSRTYLARGLSAGSELEYADESTIAQAVANRAGH